MRNYWLRITGGFFGTFIILLMLFANQMGLQSFPTWGIRRTALLIFGMLLLTVAIFYREDNIIGSFFSSSDSRLYLGLILLNGVIFLIYLWFASDGLWKTLPNETNYYDFQADAFAQGQLELDVQPDQALMAIPDQSIYEPDRREGIPVLWDATLYNGKYYLYWGPAPALLITPVKLFYKEDISDKFLALLFLIGSLAFLNLIILDLWRRYFSHLPRWVNLSAVAFAGLVNPMPYIMVEGRIYEAAIVAAQFFLMGGFYFLLPALDKPTKPRLVLAGTFFALAIGSRTTVLPAIGLLSILFLIWAIQTQRPRLTPILLSFAIPLLVGGLMYGWYNLARFDSFTEFGYRYQLTSYNLYDKIGETFAVEYLPPNLYKTLLNPLEVRDTFPHLFPTRWAGPAWLTNYHPKMYMTFTENITGLLVGSPFVLFALLAFINPRKDLRWTLASLSLAFLGVFFTLQAFFFVAMRYMLDAVPTLALVAVVGYWHGFEIFKNRKAYTAVTSTILIFTIVVSLLISYSGNLELFRIHNPDLIQRLAWMLNGLLK